MTRSNAKIVPPNAKPVLGILAQYKAMPLLELMSMVDISDAEVQSIVEDLERKKLVSIADPGTLDEIVAIRDQGLQEWTRVQRES